MEVLERRVIEDWMLSSSGRRGIVPSRLKSLQPGVSARYQSERRCKTCGWIKGFEEFRRSTNGYLESHCRDCQSELYSVYYGCYYEANADAKKLQSRQWARDHPERKRQNNRACTLKSKYGLNLERFAAMLAAQGGGCAICGLSNGERQMCVDHDHACCPGKASCGDCVRGLLCTQCNAALGNFRDDEDLLLSAVSYLRQHRG